ncbi:MAG: hypothetical protein P1Q69_15290, partial [Candidatus Thorarchaeota archaeon]|nr:hypothetical protein [Candidatus Thorarchaeota archaeon]
MKELQEAIPKSKHKQIQQIFLRASKRAESIISGKTPEDQEGPFGETLDLLSFEVAKKGGADLSSFSKAKKVDERLLDIYRDIIENPSYDDIEECLILGMYGYVVGNYS